MDGDQEEKIEAISASNSQRLMSLGVFVIKERGTAKDFLK